MIPAEVLEAHRPYGVDCKCGEPINSDAGWAAHVRDVLRGLLTVRSVEELDALPEGSVVKDSVGVIWEKDCGWWTPGIDMERVVEPDWVPALVLYRPDWKMP